MPAGEPLDILPEQLAVGPAEIVGRLLRLPRHGVGEAGEPLALALGPQLGASLPERVSDCPDLIRDLVLPLAQAGRRSVACVAEGGPPALDGLVLDPAHLVPHARSISLRGKRIRSRHGHSRKLLELVSEELG